MTTPLRPLLVAGLAGSLAALGGCAVMNTSVVPTAETLEAGHVRLGAQGGLGLELASAVYLEGDESGTFDEGAIAPLGYYGLAAGVGLTDRLELDAEFWGSIGGAGVKVNGKYRLSEVPGRTLWAVAPGLTYVTTESDDNEASRASVEDLIADVTSVGGELPVVVTRRLNDHVAVSGAARYAIDAIDVTFPEGSALSNLSGNYVLHRFAIVNSWSLSLGALYVRPEIGLEAATQVHGDLGVIPILAVGAGLEF